MKSDNELIATFMGFKLQDNPNERWYGQYFTEANDAWSNRIELLHFDTSWDWLMPVVEKIEGLDDTGGFFDCHFQILRNGSFVIDRCGETVIEIYGNDKLKATYKAVIQFIKWYNNEIL